jgi:hypothetical protein
MRAAESAILGAFFRSHCAADRRHRAGVPPRGTGRGLRQSRRHGQKLNGHSRSSAAARAPRTAPRLRLPRAWLGAAAAARAAAQAARARARASQCACAGPLFCCWRASPRPPPQQRPRMLARAAQARAPAATPDNLASAGCAAPDPIAVHAALPCRRGADAGRAGNAASARAEPGARPLLGAWHTRVLLAPAACALTPVAPRGRRCAGLRLTGQAAAHLLQPGAPTRRGAADIVDGARRGAARQAAKPEPRLPARRTGGRRAAGLDGRGRQCARACRGPARACARTRRRRWRGSETTARQRRGQAPRAAPVRCCWARTTTPSSMAAATTAPWASWPPSLPCKPRCRRVRGGHAARCAGPKGVAPLP